MKKLAISVLSYLAIALAALAQSPAEILSRMEAELDKHDDSEGIAMTVDVKVPILGTMTTRCYSLGDKTRVEGTMAGVKIVTFTDGVTEWTYTDKNNEIEITKAKPSSSADADGDMALFEGVQEGYDITLKKEDAKAWYLNCKKSKDNKDKDAPKSIDIAVRKSDYFPLSLSASISGTKMTMRDFSFGVTEKQVTFDIKDYPGATVEDKR